MTKPRVTRFIVKTPQVLLKARVASQSCLFIASCSLVSPKLIALHQSCAMQQN
jgi:hypothetical protein